MNYIVIVKNVISFAIQPCLRAFHHEELEKAKFEGFVAKVNWIAAISWSSQER